MEYRARGMAVAVAAFALGLWYVARARRQRKQSAGTRRAVLAAGTRRAVLWVSGHSLRVADNAVLLKACKAGADGLAIVYVWRRQQMGPDGSAGRGFSASAAFEAAALASFDRELRKRGNRLVVLRATEDSEAASAVAAFALASRASTIVVDPPPGLAEIDVGLMRAGADVSIVVESTDNVRMIPLAHAVATLGRSRSGGGGKVLRWAAFLAAGMSLEVPRPQPPPLRLPSPLHSREASEHALPAFVKTMWAKRMLSAWPEVSEEAAAMLASAAGRAATRSTDIGEFVRGEGAKADGGGANDGGIQRPSKLSPYLRWGVISPREAYYAGVRRRDLLWRDWSYLCITLLAPLRRGAPVIATLDGVCSRGASLPVDAARTRCLSEAAAANSTPDPYPQLKLPATPAHLSWLSEASAFATWCVGCTGAPLVDAGMRQLWVEGWMPRRVRLLCACCMCEGMGLDWRLGRDWMAATLLDHDPAINEMMWQNAGLVGCDPFYVSLRWEEHGGDDESVEDTGPGTSVDGQAYEHTSVHAIEWVWSDYVRRWLSEEMRWPPHLRHAASQRRPPIEAVVAAAVGRRIALRDAYGAAGFVGRAGVRVDYRAGGGSGEVLGVGKIRAAELASGTDHKFSKAMAAARSVAGCKV